MYSFVVQVPWLLFVNLLVMFILMVLLYCATALVSDIIKEGDAEVQSEKLGSRDWSNNMSIAGICSEAQQSKANVDQITVIKDYPTSSTSRTRTTRTREVKASQEGERFSTANKAQTDIKAIQGGETLSTYSYSPCNLLQLVGKVFLSCLGLHSTSQDSSHDHNTDGQ